MGKKYEITIDIFTRYCPDRFFLAEVYFLGVFHGFVFWNILGRKLRAKIPYWDDIFSSHVLLLIITDKNYIRNGVTLF